MHTIKYKLSSRIGAYAIALGVLFSSCQDFLDVDKDNDNPTNAPLSLLLTGSQVDLNNLTNFNLNGGTILSVYTHQTTTREEYDQYGLKVDNINMLNDWNAVYYTLLNINNIISRGTESGDLVYVGIAQIEKAYIMSVAVDLWGDVPFSEAGRLESGIISPKFDEQRTIYNEIFALLDAAKENINSGEGLNQPATDDLIYEGDTDKWIRFANTFKLKLYNQTRKVSDFDTAGFNALVAEGNFMTSNADDFEFKHYNVLAPVDERNLLFLESYNSTQFGSYQSPWFYEIMKGVNPNIHNGNRDPRIPYYFFNQLQANQLPVDQGNPETGDPVADYWDASTGFFSIRFGSVGPNVSFSAENSYTYPGIFPAGGRYDDGEGASVNVLMAGTTNRPTGIAPHRILTYDEFLYIQAELIHVGLMSGSASAKLREAMEASFAKVDQVVAANDAPQDVPVLAGTAAANTFIDNVIAEFNSAGINKKLEIIMTQKWVATYGDPMDQYNDYRRTGFPVLADPLAPSPEYQLDNGDDFPLDDSDTVLSNPYQFSWFWPVNELNVNSNAPAQKNPASYKIFWDID
ncbi:SusD/RagB family nutrient-binding outer membrane lipoprotein [Flavobacterium sp.]|uniref:SusD/RagB family nutrient-binding outer membrane lipoprotein n=1 Tax=Flavobacterium sp. TaxID=239 RepID=UPI003B9CB2ED